MRMFSLKDHTCKYHQIAYRNKHINSKICVSKTKENVFIILFKLNILSEHFAQPNYCVFTDKLFSIVS